MYVITAVVMLTWFATALVWLGRGQLWVQDRVERWFLEQTADGGVFQPLARVGGFAHPGLRLGREQVRTWLEKASRVLLVICVIQVVVLGGAMSVGSLVEVIAG